MNLMSLLQEEAIIEKPIEQPNNGIYYLATLLTNVQKDLLELIIEIFRQELITISKVKQQRNTIDSLLDSNGPSTQDNENRSVNGRNNGEGFSHLDKINLLFDQLRLVDRHPSLLVDHFIPRKLLLSDVNERMLNVSGKFQLFNRIVDSFIDRYPLQAGEDNINNGYHMLVVASSVKELELIEGLIIGKKLRYKNMSSGKLYEDNREMPKFNQKGNQDRNLASASINIHNPSIVEGVDDKISSGGGDSLDGHRKRQKTYKRSSQPFNNVLFPTEDSNLCLFLITTQQLYNYSFDTSMDLIVSFDVSLDAKSPSVDFLRTSSSNSSLNGPIIKTPIVMPIPGLSIEHCILNNPPPPTNLSFHTHGSSSRNELDNPYVKWKLQVINAFVVNRFQLYNHDDEEDDFYVRCYGNNMSKMFGWFNNWSTVNFPLSTNLDSMIKEVTGRSLSTSFHSNILQLRLKENFLFDFGPIASEEDSKQVKIESETIFNSKTVDYKSFKRHFAKVLIERVATIDSSIKDKFNLTIENLRQRETKIQQEIDQDNIQIGERYKELQKCNEEALSSEKKVVKVDGDYNKLSNKESILQSRISHLKEILMIKVDKAEETPVTLSLAAEPSVDILINSQFATIDELRSKLGSVNEELSKLNEENEKVRKLYQDSSSAAVQESWKLDKLKEVNSKYKQKLNGPGSKVLPDLLRKDELIGYEFELSKLKKENEFIEALLSEKLNKIIKERQTTMESTGAGSSSRGARLSRASTPF
ncbi:HDA1 complex subunit 2 [[Candida] railenensis]|uniref:HDA1 complex subunit 2 n=1 Tax=[Candida] railenensis TaxID=45579 RepID=A0A9P0VYZ1_9ASCO|nr:HDA1 complex subunit 2 [[Candida] railenensis]